MAYPDKPIDDETKDAAKKMAAQAGAGDEFYVNVGDCLVPLWVTFVSRAEQLIKERRVFSK